MSNIDTPASADIASADIASALDAEAVRRGLKRFCDYTPEEIAVIEQQMKLDGVKARQRQIEECREDTFERICPDESLRNWTQGKCIAKMDAINACREWSPNQGAWLWGESGLGKSRIVYQMAKKYCLDHTFKILDSGEFNDFAKQASMSEIGETRFIEPLVSADVFCIDDLAKRATAISWQLLFLIIDRRNKRDKPMLITAQFPPEELTKRAPVAFKPDATALIRRFTESCKIIHFQHK